MAKVKFSVNRKLNNILNYIYDELLHFCGTKKECISEIRRYKKEFPRETDYNLAQYGNLTIYHEDLRDAYKKAGYGSTVSRLSDHKLWDTYKRQVGFVARYILDHNK